MTDYLTPHLLHSTERQQVLEVAARATHPAHHKMKYTGPKVKLSHALGIPLTANAARVMEKKPHPPGAHGRTQTFRCKLLDADAQPVAYLALDKNNLSITVLAEPRREEIPIICDLPQVIEFYSR